MIEYLEKEDYITINRYVVEEVGGTNFGVQSESSLDVVTNLPMSNLFGREIYPTIYDKAAIMLQKITKKHVFVDGNKRTAFMATKAFLYLNGLKQDVDLTDTSIETFLISITIASDSGAVTEIIAEWLRRHFN
ncbi:type II toxin-antitoxin system death-on-curing family toxin [Latilactobacillus sakei]|uniref:Type II toxin-antitoxin system death-on-curing family toxin n=1 Tax=Latilactobacillus sakei TaxID=1599 RepID=A0AAF0GSC8_LATSK|nr:type II toxin-antitoxin system death-on-curing family toxin [Latilactobacillus sakei]MDN4009744.1 type II toxin-antitoxin system death-on-curing family toxin [Latilactobacillus sakei]WGI19035.1 type II toxin-antitoxin system death-on-curing family toxin [Latilactobacillus sakei]